MKLSNIYKPFATAVIFGQIILSPILLHAETIPAKFNVTQQELQIANTKVPMNVLTKKVHTLNLKGDSSHDKLDFGEKSQKDTNDFVTKEFKEQTKGLRRYQVEALQDYNEKNHKNVNQSLIRNQGKVVPNDPNKSQITLLDSALQDVKTENTLKVYTQQEGSLPKIDSIAEGLVIKIPEYMTPTLNHTSSSKDMWVIQIPKGTHAAYMNNLNNVKDVSGLLIERGSRIQITNIHHSTEMGIPRTIIEGKLLTKEEISEEDTKIDEAEQEFTDTFGLSVSLNLDELSSPEKTETLTKAEHLIHTVNEKLQELPNGKKIINSLVRAGVTIRLEGDRLINPEGLSILGEFQTADNSLYIDMNHDVHQDENELNNTLLHEIGHAMDYRVLKLISHDSDFQQIFALEKQAYTTAFGFDIDTLYEKEDLQGRAEEYWADSFARFILETEKLKVATPQTYAFIDKYLHKSL